MPGSYKCGQGPLSSLNTSDAKTSDFRAEDANVICGLSLEVFTYKPSAADMEARDLALSSILPCPRSIEWLGSCSARAARLCHFKDCKVPRSAPKSQECLQVCRPELEALLGDKTTKHKQLEQGILLYSFTMWKNTFLLLFTVSICCFHNALQGIRRPFHGSCRDLGWDFRTGLVALPSHLFWAHRTQNTTGSSTNSVYRFVVASWGVCS